MNKTIAILGIDGTGKSSVIKALCDDLGDRCVVTYMGYRSFENPEIDKLRNKAVSSLLYKISKSLYVIWLIYKCYWKRYYDSVKTKKIIIFDRYVHEIYINANGFYKFLYTLLYRYFYPNPVMIIYLHCPVEVSLKRKDDILDKTVFSKMKQRFDKTFLNRRGVLSLDSSIYTTEELAEIIKSEIASKKWI